MDFFVETARRKTKSEVSQAILYYSADFSVRGGITYPSAPSGTSQRLWACTDAGCIDKRNFEAGTGGRRSRFSGLLEAWGDLQPIWLPVVIITILTTVIVMVVTGRSTQFVIRKDRRKEKK